jgi:hypothetical protein
MSAATQNGGFCGVAGVAGVANRFSPRENPPKSLQHRRFAAVLQVLQTARNARHQPATGLAAGVLQHLQHRQKKGCCSFVRGVSPMKNPPCNTRNTCNTAKAQLSR